MTEVTEAQRENWRFVRVGPPDERLARMSCTAT